jgi:redox-sensitive bicupin YhaK (pirin superfamily)
MEKIIHREETRGKNHLGWLEARHSFSFGHWHSPDRNGFGQLLVLNDDIIAPESGFGTHPHKDMEIITIPLSGKLTHKDSMGAEGTIDSSMVQVMSAGTGVFHSETNEDDTEPVSLLQIWIKPKEYGIKPRYDEKEFDPDQRLNKIQQLVGPDSDSLSINQDAAISITDIEEGRSIEYNNLFRGNGVYAFVIEGRVNTDGERLLSKDAIGVSGVDHFSVTAEIDSQVLFIEVPMD